jgi:GAF domain-containing protein
VSDGVLVGSLNLYATGADAFDDEAREIGLILAAHASLAAQAVHQRDALEQLSSDLHRALSSRDAIGQAKGILMERLEITPEDAFDTLRRASQRLNLKLREIAERLAETGEFDDTDGGGSTDGR